MSSLPPLKTISSMNWVVGAAKAFHVDTPTIVQAAVCTHEDSLWGKDKEVNELKQMLLTDKKKLIQQWIALDMIESKHGTLPLDVTAEKYIDELKRIYLLQVLERPQDDAESSSASGEMLCMHNLAHDLARSVAGEDILVILDAENERNAKYCDYRYAHVPASSLQSIDSKAWSSKASSQSCRRSKQVRSSSDISEITSEESAKDDFLRNNPSKDLAITSNIDGDNRSQEPKKITELNHSPILPYPRDPVWLRVSSTLFDFLEMGSSNHEPVPSLRTDGWLQKPALGFSILMQIPDKIQNSLKVHFGRLLKKNAVDGGTEAGMLPMRMHETGNATAAEVRLNKQLQAWKNNPSWSDEPPEIKVTVPEGSLCKLNLKFKAGLPPDAVYNIIIDPENKRVFKNIKDVISRKVVLDEGSRQIVEVEQAAIWRFLWWSGVLSVHVFVDQNRRNHTVKFKQGRTGFMKKFEGCWKIEPLFVDKEACHPLDPCTLEDGSCTNGTGRVGSSITLDQLIEPAMLPPPPFSWYLRGITTRTTEMLVNDLIAETARLRGMSSNADEKQDVEEICDANRGHLTKDCNDIKDRWRQRRKAGRQGNSRRLSSQG
ncbi:hypothetical protein GUJ93_ZPchr0002g25454 [Zizania palustris]|uniref:Uncharacterized protein n=1 Tax=Zizania palustris TaxID=103762 RepID=A0A8J5RU55_ZIZPA|nr:hypothetical protein GUJ93_ZPchr0002g25454 [Zizania palustris]